MKEKKNKVEKPKGVIVISSAGSFHTDEQKDRFRELWLKPNGFKWHERKKE
jgi:hypothetical protein